MFQIRLALSCDCNILRYFIVPEIRCGFSLCNVCLQVQRGWHLFVQHVYVMQSIRTLENRPYLLTSDLSYYKYSHFHNDKPRPFLVQENKEALIYFNNLLFHFKNGWWTSNPDGFLGKSIWYESENRIGWKGCKIRVQWTRFEEQKCFTSSNESCSQ